MEWSILEEGEGVVADPRSLTFTCTAGDCGHRSTHEFSRRSYEKGLVIVQCPQCKNRCVSVLLQVEPVDGRCSADS